MLFSPSNPLLGLWDTWIFPHQDAFHLYYMQRDLRDFGCKVIGHATSPDLIHWQEERDAITVTRPPHWSAGPLMTGMVVQRGERDFLMYYGGMVEGVQRIGVALSSDLYDWKPYHANPILQPDSRWYETDPYRAANLETAWRDPCIVFDPETRQYYAFFCARVPGSDYVGGGCIGLASSSDLIQWEVHPPVYVSDRYFCLEVPDVFELNGTYYLMFSTGVGFGSYFPTADPHIANGTFYLMSDHLLSGWHEPTDNIVIGSRESRLDSYVGRTFTLNGKRLFHHHYVLRNGPELFYGGSLGSIKQVIQGEDRSLRIVYDETLEACMQPVGFPEAASIGHATWQRTDDGYAVNAVSGDLLALDEQRDLMLTARLYVEGEGRAGFVFGFDALPAQGLAVVYHAASGTVEIGMIKRHSENVIARLAPIQSRRLHPHQVDADGAVDVRLLVKDQYLDLYVNDQLTLVFVWVKPLHGVCALYAESSHCVFTQINLRQLRLTALG